jgi:DNA (cytosine-5)-methyltransferase 1
VCEVLRLGSLFSGVGMLDAGLAQAGLEHAWFCESDPWRRDQLRQRWPGVPVYEDVRKLRARDVAPVDGVVGGFPCKGVSSAGLRTGFDHAETVLWREMARVVGELGPAYVVLENVANLLTLKKGLVWQEVLETLAALGFDVVWDCLPAAAVGAPHLRDRVFAVAADASRVREGRTGQATGSDGERTRAGIDVASDADDGRQPEQPQLHGEQRPGLDGESRHDALGRGVRVEWGNYEPAVRRWEAIHGPAPEPLVRRLDDGDAKLRRVRSRVDRSRLSALGDGVHVYVGRLVGEYLVWLDEQRRLQRKERDVTHA